MAPDKRRELAEWLIEQLGSPYVYGAKGGLRMVDGAPMHAYDCSGLVACSLAHVGHPPICPRCSLDLKGFHNAQRFWDELEPLGPGEKPAELDLAFYGWDQSRVDHVMYVWGDGRALGSTGGNRYTTDPVEALRKGQKVQFRSSPFYRPDCLGFRKLPL
jgi:cell wall-associated NlpC family hydrolase